MEINLRVIIWKFYHVNLFKQVFKFVEDIVDWSDRAIVNFCYFFFEIVQLTWWKFSTCCEELCKNLTSVARELPRSTVLHCCDVLIVNVHG